MEESDAKKGKPEDRGKQSSQRTGAPAKTSSPGTTPDSFDGATMMDAPAPAPPRKSSQPEPDPDMTHVDSPTTPPAPSRGASQSASGAYAAGGTLNPGDVIGERYEVLQLLGEGGMGAVYKARDRELDRLVALKVVRPELARNPEIVRRFKQELILARQVTHKNVIRIHDLGQAEGLQFITMDFVEGQDLRGLLRERGKLPPEQAARIMLQICRALEAAHTEGVIHRDLKPQNVMLDTGGRVYVMDFGIARSALLPGMTQTGALIGTPEYMSPEQARGEKLTERSDIFSLGVIFYELLMGGSPYASDTPLATLWKRMQEKAVPPTVTDPAIPKPLSDIVVKALEIEPEDRFATAGEMAAQLELWLGPGASGTTTIVVQAPRTSLPWKWLAVGAVAVLAVAGGVAYWVKGPAKPAAPHAPVTVLVADFTNHTGDPIFDGTLEPMFNVALEGASFINAYNRGTAHKLAQKLPNPTDKLDEQPARLVALSQGISAVITGEITLRGNSYTVSVMALDAATGNVLAKSEATAANKDEVVGTVPEVVTPIRKALGDKMQESVFPPGAFTAASVEVVHQYGLGSEHALLGDWEGAMRYFAKTVELDPSFARAYSGTSAMAYNLGQRQLAEENIKLAMEHVDRMTEREKYRLRGQYYHYTGNNQKAVEEYKELLARYPADLTGRVNLAAVYADLLDFSDAVEMARRAVEIAPKRAITRENLSFYSSYAGDFHTGEQEARAAIELSPSSEISHLALAEAQLGQGQLSQATETYHNLEKLSATGASMAASGLADLAVYEGRFADAVRILEQIAAAELAAKNPESAADKFVALGHTQLLRGQNRAALAATEKALAIKHSTKAKFVAGQNFVVAGELTKAQNVAAALASETTAEPQAYAKIIEGDLALKRGEAREAIKALTDAKNLLDTWMGRFELARAYLEAGAFVEADAELDQCLKRRGEALELWLNNVVTYGYFPPVYYLQGRVQEGLKSRGFAEPYRNYLSIRGNAGEDPLIPEIKRRLGQ
jgi:tetratricopeptide (TPR) repeat protein